MSKTILVTGAGRGLGRALAQRLSDRGDAVVAHARTAAALEGVPHERALIADLEDPAGLADAVADAGIGRLDAVVHNAGVLNVAAVGEETLEWWRRTLTVNVIAAAELTRLLLPALREAGGHVLFLNSGAGLSAAARLGSYAASKHALKALADALRAEERANGVRVTSFYPSHFDTDMQRGLRDRYGADYDPERAISLETVARTVVDLLDTPADMVVNDLRAEPPNPLPLKTGD
jgi:NAD(P)-dependent dehydrogenase (short-subunit alcohol dehydrogenase family)